MCRAIFILSFFFKLIGLATFSVIAINKPKQHKKRTVFFVFNKLGICYNIILGCLIIGSNYITLPLIYYAEYVNKTVIITALEILQGVLGSIVIVGTLFCYCLNQSAFVKVGNHLIDILEQLRRLREPVNGKRIIFVLISVYLFELVLISAITVTDYLAFDSKLAYRLVHIVPSAFVNWLFIQYYSVLLVMHAIFMNANKILQNTIASRTNDIQINFLNRSRRAFIDNVKIQSLLQLRRIHSQLSNISVQLSCLYSFPILLGTIYKFVVLLNNTYYLLESFVIQTIIVNPSIIINILLWVVSLLYSLGLLTTEVTTVINEVEQMGSTVHAMLNHTFDREVKSELKLFSLQLLHERVQFSANGYFVLDNTLFQSILSTVTTYLVILIQFEMEPSESSRDTCTCNDANRKD